MIPCLGRWYRFILGFLALSGAVVAQVSSPNILIILIDDCGNDKIGCYGEHVAPPPTPNIDSLAANGVLFRNAYANPLCSPTRSLILTGRHGFRTGLGMAILKGSTHDLSTAEVTIPELLDVLTRGRYDHSAVGKWHLGLTGDVWSPNHHGFHHYSGALDNLNGEDYFSWTKTVNGSSFTQNVYATTDQIDDTIARIGAMPQPWFLWLALNAGHSPWHAPPAHLHSYTLSGNPADSIIDHYNASIEAVDTELGRLFASVDPAVLANTMIFFVGDNGTPWAATTSPTGKGSLYEGGVNVPLIVAGPLVREPGREVTALVDVADVFRSIPEVARSAWSLRAPRIGTDSVSLMPYLRDAHQPPIRSTVYAERFEQNGYGPYDMYQRMVRDSRYKLIEFDESPPRADEFYDMHGVDWEGANLLLGALTPREQAAYDRLKQVMLVLRRSPG